MSPVIHQSVFQKRHKHKRVRVSRNITFNLPQKTKQYNFANIVLSFIYTSI